MPQPEPSLSSAGAGSQKYQKRVDKIMQRLNDMQLDIETDKQSKLYNLDSQLEQTDQTLSQWHQSNMSKFSQFKEQVTECLKYIEQDKQSREYEHET